MNEHKMNFNREAVRLKSYLIDPLRRNALFLMAAGGFTSLFGFFFWLIAARFYSTSQVGLATALISAMSLLAGITKLGLDFGLVRFLPRSQDKPDIINTCFTLVGVLSILAAIVFILGLGFWAPKLLFIRDNWIYIFSFVIFSFLTTIGQLQGQVYIAFRAAHLTFIQSLLSGFDLLLIIPFIFMGAFGIFAAAGLATILTTMVGMYFLVKLEPGYRPFITVRKTLNNEMIRFSLGNYMASLLSSTAIYLMPLIIIGVLDTESSAYFTIAFALSSIMGIITTSTSSSLFAEGSYDPDKIGSQIVKSLKFISIFIIPVSAILLIFGKLILSLFGPQYAKNCLTLMWLFALSWIPNIVNMLYLTLMKIQKNIRALIYVEAALLVLTIGISYALMRINGLVGVGLGFLGAQGFMAIITGILLIKKAGASPKNLLRRLKGNN